GIGAGTEEYAAGIQREGASVDFAANDAGHVCVDRHVRSTEGAALPGADAVVLFGAGFRYLGVAADVEAGTGGRSYGSRSGGECLGGSKLRLRKVGGGHRKHALVVIKGARTDLSSVVGALSVAQCAACTINFFSGLLDCLHGIDSIDVGVAHTRRQGGDFGFLGVINLRGVLDTCDHYLRAIQHQAAVVAGRGNIGVDQRQRAVSLQHDLVAADTGTSVGYGTSVGGCLMVGNGNATEADLILADGWLDAGGTFLL